MRGAAEVAQRFITLSSLVVPARSGLQSSLGSLGKSLDQPLCRREEPQSPGLLPPWIESLDPVRQFLKNHSYDEVDLLHACNVLSNVRPHLYRSDSTRRWAVRKKLTRLENN